MSKKLSICIFSLVFLIIFSYHFIINVDINTAPPSQKWGKEVQISTGDFNTAPKIIYFQGNYVIAHNYSNKAKVILVDKTGKKIKEQEFTTKTGSPSYIGLLTNGEEIYLNWIENEGDRKNLELLTLDKEFKLINTKETIDIEDSTEIDDRIMLISFKDRIEIKDLKLNTNTVVKDSFPRSVSGTKINNKYIVSYSTNTDLYRYFYIENGAASKPKNAGHMPGIFRMTYIGSNLVTDGEFGYVLNPYTYLGSYGGINELVFKLDSNKEGETRDFTTSGGVSSTVTDITVNIPGGNGKILASTDVALGKKRIFPNICEFTIVNGVAESPVALSRTRSLSLRTDIANEAVVFCDFLSNKSKVYMTSTNEEFKKVNNGNRPMEFGLAFLDTIEESLYALAYMFPYASLWLIPAICVSSLLCLIEYKLGAIARKVSFILVYLSYFLVKAFFIFSISFKRYRMLIPPYITPLSGEAIAAAISLLCCVIGYKNYTKDLEYNVIAKSSSPIFVVDSFLTMMFFVPFIK